MHEVSRKMPNNRVCVNSPKAELVLSSCKYNQLQHCTGGISSTLLIPSAFFLPFFFLVRPRRLAIKYQFMMILILYGRNVFYTQPIYNPALTVTHCV